MTILKSIVACLALANAVYFLWARGIGERGPAASVAPAPAASLKLASESAAPGPAVEAAERAVGGGIAGASGGDSGGGSGSDGGDVRAAASETAALLTDVKRCISVGPFRDVAETARAASTLRSGGYDPRQRVAEGEVWAGIWVYLPITAAHSSEQMQAKLKAGGIEDALEMPGPGPGSVLSLGLYGDTKRAQARVSQLQAMGFNPGMADRKRTGDTYWIDIDLKPTDSVLKPSDLAGETGRIVRLEVKACPATPGGGAP